MANDLKLVATRYREILKRIQASVQAGGRTASAEPVTLIAVSKSQPPEAVETLYALGHRDFGENYVQEIVPKAELLKSRGCADIRWHFIGALQTNKIKALLPWAFAVHTVDKARHALELSKQCKAARRGLPLPVFIEVNIDSQPTKGGAKPGEVIALAKEVAAMPGLSLQGLMGIPEPVETGTGTVGSGFVVQAGTDQVIASQTIDAFRRLRELEISCRPRTLGKLSMGMTQDFEAALREGATHLRLGTALFGPRSKA